MKPALARICLVAALLALIYLFTPLSGGFPQSLSWLGSRAFDAMSTTVTRVVQAFCDNAREGELEEEIRALKRENLALSTALATGQPIGRPANPLLAARIITYSPLDTWQGVTLGAGVREGITSGDVAVDAEGHLVGRIIRTAPHTSELLLITNPSETIDSRIGDNGYRAVVSGVFRSLSARRGLWLTHGEYIDRESPIAVGDIVVTSGLDGRFSPGLPLGKIHSVGRDKLNLFQEAVVMPLVDFTLLKEVFVIGKTP
jgi:rod shape-determining protein MreC